MSDKDWQLVEDSVARKFHLAKETEAAKIGIPYLSWCGVWFTRQEGDLGKLWDCAKCKDCWDRYHTKPRRR